VTHGSRTTALLAACSMAEGPFPAEERRCDWCGGDLTGRQRRWCSVGCSTAFTTNHLWSHARRAAKLRDRYRCTTCGAELRQLRPVGKRLEVNHIEPVMGKHNVSGCWHHLDGLETLCVDCHKPITAAQATARAEARRNA
jgi:5-methylcytosine-specific restriction endonuclease McrA